MSRSNNKKKMAAARPFQPADGQLDTLLCWFPTALPARTKALELTHAACNEPDPFRRVHFVVALQHGSTVRAADGSYARVPILDAAGKKLKGFKYLPFNVAQLAHYMEHLRIHRPACMNLFEEVNNRCAVVLSFLVSSDAFPLAPCRSMTLDLAASALTSNMTSPKKNT
jgi:hypothetical protein